MIDPAPSVIALRRLQNTLAPPLVKEPATGIGRTKKGQGRRPLAGREVHWAAIVRNH